jgi:uncharacterized membrane protein YidH (DUF202 family)
MHDGHLTNARPVQAWTRESIGLAMAGVAAGATEAAAATPSRSPAPTLASASEASA